jgi:Rrf2 family protein
LAINSSIKKKIGVNVIAEELVVPKQFLSKILQELVKYDIVGSSKGKYGGFYLTKRNLNKNLRSIIEVFDGDDIFKECVMGLAECSSVNPCPLHDITTIYRMQLIGRLEDKSIKEIADQVQNEGLTI